MKIQLSSVSAKRLTKVLFGLGLLLTFTVSGQEVIYVSPDGSDVNSGQKRKPVASLNRAVVLAEEHIEKKGYPGRGIVIQLADGTYVLQQSITLNQKLSGTEAAPFTIKAEEGANPVISGGVSLSPSDFEYVGDVDVIDRFINPDAKNHVMVADLKSLGINNYGELIQKGFPKRSVKVPVELVFNDQFLKLAQWPNEEKLQFGEIVESGSAMRHNMKSESLPKFRYDHNRPALWESAEDIWVSGIFCQPWSPDFIKIRSIDRVSGVITLDNDHHYGLERHEYHDGFQVSTWHQFVNILEELDAPGEWYLDRDKGLLYIWPPSDIQEAKIQLTSFDEPFMMSLKNTSYVNVEGLTFELTRQNGIEIANGDHNVITDCTIQNIGGRALNINSGQIIDAQNGIRNSLIHGIGLRGVGLYGGNVKTLDAGGNFVENCEIFDISRVIKTYTPAVEIGGVGNRVAHCEIHDVPQFGLSFSGNDHIIEFNEFYDVAKDFSDAGAIYTSSGPLNTGHVIRYNYFHEMGLNREKVNGIYLDHGVSGSLIYGNVFYKIVARDNFGAIMFNGGNDNTVENNLFLDCKTVLHISNYLNGWGYSTLERFLEEWGDDFKERNAGNPPYSYRYPHLATFYEDNWRLPKRNQFERNLMLSCEQLYRFRYEASSVHKDNFSQRLDPNKIEEIVKNKDLNPVLDLVEKIEGFEMIPFQEIGLNK